MANIQIEMGVTRAQEIIGYSFGNTDRLVEALQAPGSGLALINGHPIIDGNKRLAILGDTVIRTVALCRWYDTNEGRAKANQILSNVGARATLETLARTIGLDTCVSRNPGQQHEPASPVLLRSTAAAVVGAVWLDSGHNINTTWQVMRKLGISDVVS